MKRLKIILLAIIASLNVVAQDNDRMREANALCQDSKFDEAAQIYESIRAQGLESATLYYNLGYAYYKQASLGKAILNFERAHRLAPNDDDIAFNLEQAYALTDKMQTIEPIFFVRWWQAFCNITNSDGWAVVFVVLFILMLGGIAAFMFANSVSLRKLGFFSAIIFLLLACVSLGISSAQKDEILDGKAAIIMSSSVTLSTSPDKNGSEMAVLHEGTHVDILSRLGDWCEVRLKDGNVGWLKASDIEVI